MAKAVRVYRFRFTVFRLAIPDQTENQELKTENRKQKTVYNEKDQDNISQKSDRQT